ncbi:MAG: hypothetical protein IKX36_05565 [Prevotella sp.]|nr:hypothetical protein [Prevotella sp.]
MKRFIFVFVVILTGVMNMTAQTCNRCGDEGVIRERCQVCNGDGGSTCDHCKGTGEITCETCHGDKGANCYRCEGTGKDDNGNDCYNCQGKGWFRCELCRGTGMSMCRDCNGNGTISCFNCGSTGVKVWRCPECIAAGRI